MRTIKFRAKALANDSWQWVYGYYHEDTLGAWMYTEVGFIQVDKKTVGQFTGLLDKNGKEIYKGDFVEDDMKQKEAVVMEYGEWRVYGRSLWQESKSKRIEVLGNIYENPELLTPSPKE